MKPTLRYDPALTGKIVAVCLTGSSPLQWLREIDRWGVPVHELECYLLPQSISSLSPGGLFVVFKTHAALPEITVLEPYCLFASNIYVPDKYMLYPYMTEAELKQHFVWDVQVFHPRIGLVGFAKSDKMSLSSLLQFGSAVETDWSYAHPGLEDRPSLKEITVIQLTTEDLMAAYQKEMGQKALEDIPKHPDQDRNWWQKIADVIRETFFRGLLAIISLIDKIFPKGVGGIASTRSSGSGQAGRGGGRLLSRFQRWLDKNLDELEAKRDNEMQRLLKLFENNLEEALQYAIPLDSPYLHRGQSQRPSDRLARRNTNLNLRQLGGGYATDFWDSTKYYNDLRSKYLAAAEREMALGDYKKAVYIYAHLLGDYSSAAMALEKGGFYREAATLYKEHLKNELRAAECLERGGLYHESIQLYQSLKLDEKIGDLYDKLGDRVKAVSSYERHIAFKQGAGDYLAAARVIREKLHEPERSKGLLMEGWEKSGQADSCLKAWFSEYLKDGGSDTSGELRRIYQTRTPRHRHLLLLDTLEALRSMDKGKDFTNTCRQIGYELVAGEVKDGRPEALHRLPGFVQEDKLLGADVRRYLSGPAGNKSMSQQPAITPLDSGVKWKTAVWRGGEFLALGHKGSAICLVRGNWYGNYEYHVWESKAELHQKYAFVCRSYQGSHIIIQTSGRASLERKMLAKGKYFRDELTIGCPAWLHNLQGEIAFTDEGNLCRLSAGSSSLTMYQYTVTGDLIKSIDCRLADEALLLNMNRIGQGLICHEGYYYSFTERHFLLINEEGNVFPVDLGTGIRAFATSHQFLHTFYIVISTNSGLRLCRPVNGELRMNGAYFGEQLIPTGIYFLTPDRFAVVEKWRVTLYQIEEDEPVEIRQFQTSKQIIAVMPIPKRGQFALLESDGKIGLHEY